MSSPRYRPRDATVLSRFVREVRNTPAPSEVARSRGRQVEEVHRLDYLDRKPVSLDAPRRETGERLLADAPEDDGPGSPAAPLLQSEDRRAVRAGRDRRPSRQRRALRLRLGGDDVPRTLAEVAGELGISPKRVRPIERQARPNPQKLRRALTPAAGGAPRGLC